MLYEIISAPTRSILQYTLTRTGVSICESLPVLSSYLELIFKHKCSSLCLTHSIERTCVDDEGFMLPSVVFFALTDRIGACMFVQK